MPRQAIAIALPPEEEAAITTELAAAGFEPIRVGHPDELEALLRSRRDIALAILDGETDFDTSLEYYGVLHDEGRSLPALMIVSPRTLDKLSAGTTRTGINDEYFTRPYSPDVILREAIPALPAFQARVTSSNGGNIEVTARDPEA